MLRLDTNKLYYRPSTGDKPPVVYTLGEIVSMMEKAGSWRVDSHRRRPCVGMKCREGGGDRLYQCLWLDTGKCVRLPMTISLSPSASYLPK